MSYDFEYACDEGNLELAKQLLQENPRINVSANDELSFCNACATGNLELIKWLLEIKPDIDITAHNDRAFSWANNFNHHEVVEYLVQLKPERYEIQCRGKYRLKTKIYKKNDNQYASYILK